MSHTYSTLWVHVVFSTKGRAPVIKGEFRQRLYSYMAAIINDEFGFAREIGGTADHVHLLADMKTSTSAADMLRVVKTNSSRWVNLNFRDFTKFAWQTGYGLFSVSVSLVPKVVEYIEDQEEHHRHETFEQEFVRLLEKHGISYDRKYLLD